MILLILISIYSCDFRCSSKVNKDLIPSIEEEVLDDFPNIEEKIVKKRILSINTWAFSNIEDLKREIDRTYNLVVIPSNIGAKNIEEAIGKFDSLLSYLSRKVLKKNIELENTLPNLTIVTNTKIEYAFTYIKRSNKVDNSFDPYILFTELEALASEDRKVLLILDFDFEDSSYFLKVLYKSLKDKFEYLDIAVSEENYDFFINNFRN